MSYSEMEETLIELYQNVDKVDEHTKDGAILPSNIQIKLDIYRDILEIVGDLHAIAHGQVKWHEFKKKEAYAEGYLNEQGCPVKEREQLAVIASNKHRAEQAKWERVALKWANRYKSTEHIINALKWKIRDAHHLDRGGQ